MHAARRVIESSSKDDVLALEHLRRTDLHRLLGGVDVLANGLVAGCSDDFGRGVALEVGDFFGPFVDEQRIDADVRVIVRDRGGDALQNARLALPSAARRIRQRWAATDRVDEIDGPSGDAVAVRRIALIGGQLEFQALGGIERRTRLLQILQDLEPATLLRATARTTTATGAATTVGGRGNCCSATNSRCSAAGPNSWCEDGGGGDASTTGTGSGRRIRRRHPIPRHAGCVGGVGVISCFSLFFGSSGLPTLAARPAPPVMAWTPPIGVVRIACTAADWAACEARFQLGAHSEVDTVCTKFLGRLLTTPSFGVSSLASSGVSAHAGCDHPGRHGLSDIYVLVRSPKSVSQAITLLRFRRDVNTRSLVDFSCTVPANRLTASSPPRPSE